MVEHLDGSEWQRLPGPVSDDYRFCDVDGRVVKQLDGSTYSSRRILQWRVPVLIGTLGADAFWWFRDGVYRCPRGLTSWDVQALAATAPRLPPSSAVAHPEPAPERHAHAFRQAGRYLREHGAAATANKIAERLRPHLRLDEAHAWSLLPLTASLDPPSLPDGITLVRATSENVHQLKRLPTPVTEREADRRLAAGAQLWLAMAGAIPVFSCWIFTDFAPVIAAPGGSLRLAPGDVVLEDTATHESYRGRGIAPAAWLAVAAHLGGAGYRRMLTKVELDNASSRRAFEKAGFTEAATVDVHRLGPRWRVRVTASSGTAVATMLRERLR